MIRLRRGDAGSSSSAFIGKGKLTEYGDKKDSWILNQMNTGKVDHGISTGRDSDGQIKFSSVDRMAMRVAQYYTERPDNV